MVNLVAQDFIKAIGSQATSDEELEELDNEEAKEPHLALSSVVKKVPFSKVMRKSNA